MHELNNLKTMLVRELEEHGKSGNFTKTSLDTIDKLAHAAKNVCKVIEACESDEYSNAMGNRSYSRSNSYADRSYESGYSRSNDNLKGQLYKLMEMSSDDRTREELRRFIDRI